MSLRLYIDQCVPRSVSESLQDAGHLVELLRHHLPINAKDPDVIASAQSLDAVLVTLNGDFADIINYPPARFGGIIALQVRNHPESIRHLSNSDRSTKTNRSRSGTSFITSTPCCIIRSIA